MRPGYQILNTRREVRKRKKKKRDLMQHFYLETINLHIRKNSGCCKTLRKTKPYFKMSSIQIDNRSLLKTLLKTDWVNNTNKTWINTIIPPYREPSFGDY